MAKKKRFYYPGDSESTQAAYYHGVNAGQDDKDIHAFYVGVGYGKRENGDMQLGFSSPEQKEMFKNGCKSHKNHFTVEKPGKTEWEKLVDKIQKFFRTLSLKKRRKQGNATGNITQRLHVKRRARLPRKRNR